MKIFAPELDTIWRLTEDWTPPEAFMQRSDNEMTLWGYPSRYGVTDLWRKAGGSTTAPDWIQQCNEWEANYKAERGTPQFLAGTVVVFDRYHISHSGDHAITLRVLASPDILLTPKKQKGKMVGPGRIYLLVNELNTFPEVDKVDALG